jgi:hypothetical protein
VVAEGAVLNGSIQMAAQPGAAARPTPAPASVQKAG